MKRKKQETQEERLQRIVEAELGLSTQSIVSHSRQGSQKEAYVAQTEKGKIFLGVVPDASAYPLGEEYQKLNDLQGSVPEYFPRPLFYTVNHGIQVLGMEFLTHQPISALERSLDRSKEEAVVYAIGFALGVVHARTGQYTKAPTADNILAKLGQRPCVKLVDVEHFTDGSTRELQRCVERDLDLYKDHKRAFRIGLEDGIDEA